jgi:DNA repair protein RecO (recombination protein O)
VLVVDDEIKNAELTALATEPGQPQPTIFELLEAALGAIESGQDPQLIAQGFALRLMCVLGVAPVLGECVTCSQELTGPAGYSVVAGGLICPGCEMPGESSLTISPAACGVLRSLITLPLERLDRLRMDEGSRRQVTGLLRRHIEYHLGLKLKSEEFLEKLGAEGGRP